jgi:cysteine desulfurase
LIYGGGHERGLRSGTLAVPQIVGMGKAAALAQQHLQSGEAQELARLRDLLLEQLQSRVSGISVHGSLEHRLPNNLNLSIDGVEAEALMMGIRPVAISSGSACSSEALEPSHVLRALGVDGERAQGSIRIGVGRFNTMAEIEAVAQLIVDKVAELRAMNPLYEPSGSGTDLAEVEFS